MCVGPRSAVFAPIARSRADRRRRGARRLLQARGRPALRRPRRRRRARTARQARCCCSAARRRGRRAPMRMPTRRPAPARGRTAAAARAGARHARAGPRPASADRAGAGEVRRDARQGDRAAQPPRLVELPLLPLLRSGVELPALRRRAGAAPRPAASWPATTAGTASRCRRAARTAARPQSPATAPAPSVWQHELSRHLDDGPFPSSASTPTSQASEQAGVGDAAAPLRRRPRAGC